MTKSVADIERDIRALSREEKRDLLRALIDELDTPADPNAEDAWLQAAQRRYRELIEGRVAGIPGKLVFERLRALGP